MNVSDVPSCEQWPTSKCKKKKACGEEAKLKSDWLFPGEDISVARERPGEVDALKMLQDFGNTRDVEVWPQAGWDTSIKIK